MFSTLDLRQASSGPTPVNNRRTRPTGSIQRLKNVCATVMRCPVIASLIVGNIVANKIRNAANNRIQLFSRNAASRDAQDSRSFRDRSSGSR